MHRIELSGKRFGHLLVLELATPKGCPNPKWKCQCDCGKVCEIFGSTLKSGQSTHCGCVTNRLKGYRSHPLYFTYHHMKQRCFNPKCPGYKWYGARGITVCERWLNSFEAFLQDVGPRPDGHSIDRINVNGNYEPGNVRWATAKEQNNNKQRHAAKS